MSSVSPVVKINLAFTAVQNEYDSSNLRKAFENYYDMPVRIRSDLIDIVIDRAEKDVNCIICTKPIEHLEERSIGLLGQSHISCVEKLLPWTKEK